MPTFVLKARNCINQLGFLHNNDISNIAFYSHKISNPIEKGIIFSGPNNTKYLVPS